MKNNCLCDGTLPPVFSVDIILSSITIPYFMHSYKKTNPFYNTIFYEFLKSVVPHLPFACALCYIIDRRGCMPGGDFL